MKEIKLKYEKPALQVIELKQQSHLLQTSGQVTATMNGTWDETDI